MEIKTDQGKTLTVEFDPDGPYGKTIRFLYEDGTRTGFSYLCKTLLTTEYGPILGTEGGLMLHCGTGESISQETASQIRDWMVRQLCEVTQ